MQKLSTILKSRKPSFNKVKTSDSVNHALCMMGTENFDHLLVTDDNNQFAGIVTEHHLNKKLFGKDQKTLNHVSVQEVMITGLVTLDGNNTLEDCVKLMQRIGQLHIPVYEGFNFIGVITQSDILDEAVLHKEFFFD